MCAGHTLGKAPPFSAAPPLVGECVLAVMGELLACPLSEQDTLMSIL